MSRDVVVESVFFFLYNSIYFRFSILFCPMDKNLFVTWCQKRAHWGLLSFIEKAREQIYGNYHLRSSYTIAVK